MPGVVVRAGLLQVRDRIQFSRNETPDNAALKPIVFVSKGLTQTESQYSNIERETLDILHFLQNFHNYCFTHEVSMITDHKPLVIIFKMDVVSLSQGLQTILLCIHQYSIECSTKCPQLFITDWLSRHNHKSNIDEEILGMNIIINVIESYTGIRDCMMTEEFRSATRDDEHVSMLPECVLHGCPSKRAEVQKKNYSHIYYKEMKF